MKLQAYEFTRTYKVFAKDEEDAQEKFEFTFDEDNGELLGLPDEWVPRLVTSGAYGDEYICNICNEEMTEAEEIAYGGWCANCKGQKERGEA